MPQTPSHITPTRRILYILWGCLVGATLGLSVAAAEGKSAVPDYSQTDRKAVPVEFTWKIEDIYPDLASWKADKEALQKLTAEFDLKAKDWTAAPDRMLALLELVNKANLKLARLHAYASHQSNADLGNALFQGMKGEIVTLSTQFAAKTAVMAPDVLKLGPEKFTAYLKELPALAPFRFGIEEILRGRDHVLPPEQERISTLTGLFSDAPEKASSILNDVEIPPQEITLSTGKKVALNFANYVKNRASDNAGDREAVMEAFWGNQRKYESTHAALLDGALKQHFFNAQVHRFDTCLEAKLFGNAIPKEVYFQLIRSVRANLGPLHRYIALKKKMLGLEHFRYADLFAKAVPAVTREYSFEEAKQLCLESMAPLGDDYAKTLAKAFAGRWIDVYPNKGKETGAYSGGLYGIHPFIKMNFNGTYDTVSTLAHELGHALHSDFSCRTQPFATSRYATFLAEVASTFNENLLMQRLLQSESDDRFKLFVLDSYLDRVRATLYRQTLFAEFELLMHQRVEQGQTLTADWLDETYLRLTREYYGHEQGVCEVGDYLACEWDAVPHFYLNFYVFQYSTGIIASMALSDRVLTGGAPEKERYLDFLRAGGSDHPIAILQKAGVDMTRPEPYEAALRRFDKLVGEMEAIVARGAR